MILYPIDVPSLMRRSLSGAHATDPVVPQRRRFPRRRGRTPRAPRHSRFARPATTPRPS